MSRIKMPVIQGVPLQVMASGYRVTCDNESDDCAGSAVQSHTKKEVERFMEALKIIQKWLEEE